MMIPGNVTSFRSGDVGGSSRDFQLTDFEVTSTYEDGNVELAYSFKGTRYFIEINIVKLMAAALKRAENGGTR